MTINWEVWMNSGRIYIFIKSDYVEPVKECVSSCCSSWSSLISFVVRLIVEAVVKVEVITKLGDVVFMIRWNFQ